MSAPPRTRPPMDRRIRERRRAVAQEQSRRRRRVVASVVVALALATGGVALTYTPLFEVGDVAVTGVTAEREAAVRSAAGIVTGERLLGVDLRAVAADVEALPWVRTVEVSRQPPDTLVIEVTPRQPVAVVRTASEVWLVDRDAVLVAGGGDETLVEIVAPSAVLPGVGARVGDAAVRNALAVHAELPASLRTAVVRYDAPSDRGLRMLLDGSIIGEEGAEPLWVRVGIAERVDDKARVIELLIEQLRTRAGELGGPAAAELDVRAPDNPVVVPAG